MTSEFGSCEKLPHEARERGEEDKGGEPAEALGDLDDTSMEGFLHKRCVSVERGKEGAPMVLMRSRLYSDRLS